MLYLLALFVMSTLMCTNEAYKILVVLPVKVPSQNILCSGYVDNLLRAGHEVTYLSPFPRKELPPKFRQIVVDIPDEFTPGNVFTIEKILEKKIDVTDLSSLLSTFSNSLFYFLRHKNVHDLINDPNESFDAVIVEWMFLEANAGFAAVFQAPLIWSNPAEVQWMALALVDETPNPAYAPDLIVDYFPPFTFWQRVKQLWRQISMPVIFNYLNSQTEDVYEEVFVAAGKKKGIAVPPIAEIKYNASFMFSNSHVSLGDPIRLPQNFIPIAGYHIDAKPKPLPEDLQQLMDNAKNGVIYFSMGSHIKSKFMPEKMKREFLDMFSTLKQTVLWKFEDVLPDLPSNVHIIQWAPQHSILAHPNCILFVTHGGLLSTTEAVHFGVPIIGIPVGGDQPSNVNRAVHKGFAVKVDLSYDTPKDLKSAIEEVLSNPSYRERVKYLSLVYHDRPVPPAKEMVHWVEHTVKTRGAPHLRSRALTTPWYQKMYLDLAALVAAIILVLYFTAKRLFKGKKSVTSSKKYN